MQARLFELGYYNGRIDGRYSSETTAAVKAFQKANGLSADGIAGQGTLNKLNSGNAVVSDGTTDDVTGDETDDEPTATYQPTTAYTVLRRGDKSDQVQVMQRYLATLGYLNSTPDGQFGSATERAVKLFQEANGLSADGVAGSGTLSILYGDAPVSYNAYFGSSGNGASGGTTTVAPTPVPDMTTVIQWESEGDNVRQYQQRLVELGYLDSKSVTGKFNQKTVEATKAFQTMNDLKVDGAAGPQSLKLIYSGDALDANGVRVGDKLGSASDTVTVSDVLTAGMSGEQVRQVQSRLAALGYLSASFISGTYDDATAQAVRQFQQANGLTADGTAGSATQSRLYANNAVTAQVAKASADNGERQSAEYRVNGAYQASLAGGGIAGGGQGSALLCGRVTGRHSGQKALQRRGGQRDGLRRAALSASDQRQAVLRRQRRRRGLRDPPEHAERKPRGFGARGRGAEICAVRRRDVHAGRECGAERKNALRRGERTDDGGQRFYAGRGEQDAFVRDTGWRDRLRHSDGAERERLYRRGGSGDDVRAGAARAFRRECHPRDERADGTIRRDGASCLLVYGQKVIELTSRGVMTCDVNGENATMIADGSFEAASIANGVLYLGSASGYTKSVSL